MVQVFYNDLNLKREQYTIEAKVITAFAKAHEERLTSHKIPGLGKKRFFGWKKFNLHDHIYWSYAPPTHPTVLFAEAMFNPLADTMQRIVRLPLWSRADSPVTKEARDLFFDEALPNLVVCYLDRMELSNTFSHRKFAETDIGRSLVGGVATAARFTSYAVWSRVPEDDGVTPLQAVGIATHVTVTSITRLEEELGITDFQRNVRYWDMDAQGFFHPQGRYRLVHSYGRDEAAGCPATRSLAPTNGKFLPWFVNYTQTLFDKHVVNELPKIPRNRLSDDFVFGARKYIRNKLNV